VISGWVRMGVSMHGWRRSAPSFFISIFLLPIALWTRMCVSAFVSLSYNCCACACMGKCLNPGWVLLFFFEIAPHI
jgi:hypothetical protein